MARYRWALAMLVWVVLVSVAPQADGAAGTPITLCGVTVTTNAYLTQDLYCPGSHGVVVGAPGITIDLHGFTIRGDGSGGHFGVYDTVTTSLGATVKNGALRNFSSGFYTNGDKASVLNVVASGNLDTGIRIYGDFAKIQSSTLSLIHI